MPVSTEIEGVEYLNGTEAAAYLGIARETFRKKADGEWNLEAFEDPYHRAATLYRKADLEKIKGLPIRPKIRPEREKK